MYPPSTGAEHMRSLVAYPQGKKMFPQLLREAGYYCSNNAKEDYNLAKPGRVWDDSSNKAHWRDRKPGQPFFAVFNSLKSHESKVRARPHQEVHDPAKVRVPAPRRRRDRETAEEGQGSQPSLRSLRAAPDRRPRGAVQVTGPFLALSGWSCRASPNTPPTSPNRQCQSIA